MSVKDFITGKLLDRNLKHLPEQQRDLFKRLFQQNPELLKMISDEIKQRKKDGQNEMLASVAVMKKYEGKIRELISKLK